MSGTGAFAYDLVDYPSGAFPQAHPGHLCAVGRMFGLAPAPPERCRTLEVGCGDGAHLIACAYVHPESVFVGLDLSTVAIERGNRLIAALGLPNVSLHQADLTTWEPPSEPFDYFIAHGLYSWIPAPVRDRLMALASRVLTQSGLAYISYNTFPGCHVRRMQWEMMQSAAAGESDPAAKTEKALGMVRFLLEGSAAAPALRVLVPDLKETLERRLPAVIYHDDLAEINDPVRFTEFMAHAAKHGLQFVAEAEPYSMHTDGYPERVSRMLDELAERDVVAKEQHVDYLRLRRFRQTILTRIGNPVLVRPNPARMSELFVSAQLAAEPSPADLAAGVVVLFRSKDGSAQTDWPLGKAALISLAEQWPDRLPFAELLRRAAAKLGREPDKEEGNHLAEFLTSLWMRDLIQLCSHRPPFTREVSERPVASRLVRRQAADGAFLTSLLHGSIQIEDEMVRRLIQLLDGTRTREQLRREMMTAFPPGRQPSPDALGAEIERNLRQFALGGALER